MLTDAGNQMLQTGCRDLRAELFAHGGPWAAPVAWPGSDEITDPASGMLRKRAIVDERGFLHATWVATAADDYLPLLGIGLAATEDGVFLIRADCSRVVRTGDQVSLASPLNITVD